MDKFNSKPFLPVGTAFTSNAEEVHPQVQRNLFSVQLVLTHKSGFE